MRTCLKAITADVHTYTHVRIHTRMHLTIARDIILFGEHLVHIGFVKPVAGHERKTMSDVNLCARLLNIIMGYASSYPKLIAWTGSLEKNIEQMYRSTIIELFVSVNVSDEMSLM